MNRIKLKERNPYKECELCEDLGDCPSPLVLQDGMGSPTTPEDCPKSNEVLKSTYKKHKRNANARHTD